MAAIYLIHWDIGNDISDWLVLSVAIPAGIWEWRRTTSTSTRSCLCRYHAWHCDRVVDIICMLLLEIQCVQVPVDRETDFSCSSGVLMFCLLNVVGIVLFIDWSMLVESTRCRVQSFGGLVWLQGHRRNHSGRILQFEICWISACLLISLRLMMLLELSQWCLVGLVDWWVSLPSISLTWYVMFPYCVWCLAHLCCGWARWVYSETDRSFTSKDWRISYVRDSRRQSRDCFFDWCGC